MNFSTNKTYSPNNYNDVYANGSITMDEIHVVQTDEKNITEDAFTLREKASISFDTNKFDYIINDNNKVEIKRLVKLI